MRFNVKLADFFQTIRRAYEYMYNMRIENGERFLMTSSGSWKTKCIRQNDEQCTPIMVQLTIALGTFYNGGGDCRTTQQR